MPDIQQYLCKSLGPLHLKSEINKQPSKHEPVIYNPEAIKGFEMSDYWAVKVSSSR